MFDFAELGVCELLTSPFALEEARRNLSAKSIDGIERLAGFMNKVEVVAEADATLANLFEKVLPEKDRPILAAAIGSGSEWLMTGDRQHFGNLYGIEIGGVEVLSPTEVLRRLVEDTE